MIGERCLLCCGDDKTPAEVLSDYFPLFLDIVDPSKVRSTDWFVLASAGDGSCISGRLQWLFERPLMQLIEYEDRIVTNIGRSDEQVFLVDFYIGVNLQNPHGSGSMRCEVSQKADYSMNIKLFGC